MPVHIENLEIIQKEVFKLFPKSALVSNNLFYIPDNLSLFLGIPELKSALDTLGWTEYVHAFGFYILHKTNASTLHTDTGDRTYSFNIPILNCKDTLVQFFKTDQLPTKVTPINRASYYSYDSSKCELVDSFEMNSPHVINTTYVHNVVNPNILPRITLLVRLSNTLSLDKLFI